MQQKYGSSRTSQARKQAALASSLSAIRIKETLKEVSIAPSETCDLDSVEKLPDYIYDEPVDFTQGKNDVFCHLNAFVRDHQ